MDNVKVTVQMTAEEYRLFKQVSTYLGQQGVLKSGSVEGFLVLGARYLLTSYQAQLKRAKTSLPPKQRILNQALGEVKNIDAALEEGDEYGL